MAAPIVPSPIPSDTPSNGWELVWTDEFEQPDGSAPDPEKWTYDIGAGGWGNAELQYYTDTTDNAYIENGHLVIKAVEQVDASQRYTSARVVSRQGGDWTYGRFEIRARLPAGQGIWPAIWMLPTDEVYGIWPASGEIDIMEFIGKEPNTIYGTLHYGAPLESEGAFYELPGENPFSNQFHVYALEWEPEEMRWYVDDVLYQTIDTWFTSGLEDGFPAPFDQRFHLLMNIAVGGVWPGPPDETTEFPQFMYVDYVRVYQSMDAP